MKKITFEVKEEHLKLLRNMSVEWNNGEFGAPEINPKRPYGNGGVITGYCRDVGSEKV